MAKKNKNSYASSMEFGTSKDRGFAGLPREVVMKEYPKAPYGGEDPELIDTISGIDYQMYEDTKFQKKDRWPEKY